MVPEEVAAVRAAAADYIAGWYHGDTARMDRALHGELEKRTLVRDEDEATGSFRSVSKERMLELTAAGGGEDPDAEMEIVVDDISGDIASAHTITEEYVDYLHLVRTPEGWKIANVLFRIR
ncbi:MAG: nuclear transport factor 2 family protein [Acidimicrobiia bacterium]|nr:nuclear transport factor 2 family protein [Acidimicrobiia bacterium]